MTTEQEYRATKKTNASTLKPWLSDPRRAYHLEHNPREDTASMSLGRAVHKLLEHKLNHDAVTVSPYSDYRKKEAREWRDANPDAIKAEEFNQAMAMAKSLYDSFNPDTLHHYHEGEHEKAFYTDERKALVDLVYGPHLYDFKTTSATDLRGCIKDCSTYHYDLQAAFYLDVCEAESFTFLFVSSVAPYATFHLKCSKDYLAYGREQYKKAEKTRGNYIPDTSPITHELERPYWAKVDEETAQEVFEI